MIVLPVGLGFDVLCRFAALFRPRMVTKPLENKRRELCPPTPDGPAGCARHLSPAPALPGHFLRLDGYYALFPELSGGHPQRMFKGAGKV